MGKLEEEQGDEELVYLMMMTLVGVLLKELIGLTKAHIILEEEGKQLMLLLQV